MRANRRLLQQLAALMEIQSGMAGQRAQTPVLGIVVDPSATPSELLSLFAAEYEHWWRLPSSGEPASKDLAAGKAILKLPPADQVTLLHESLERAIAAPQGPGVSPPYGLCACAEMLLNQKLPFSADDLGRILQLLVSLAPRFPLTGPMFLRYLAQIERCAADSLPPDLLQALPLALEAVRRQIDRPIFIRLAARVTALVSPSEAGLPEPNETWSAAMLDSLRAMDEPEYAAWQRLLAHAARAEQSKPSAKWNNKAASLVKQIGFPGFKSRLLAWFAGLETPAERVLSARNGQLVKGLAWACALYEDAELSGLLGRLVEALLTWLPKWPAMDWRCLKAGNGCLYALSSMPGDEPIAQLSRLNLRLKGKQLQDSTGKALAAAAARRGLAREELEELTVPAHGLDAEGSLRIAIGDATLEVAVTGATIVECRWSDANGGSLKGPPATLQAEHKSEIAALKRSVEHIRGSLAAQRIRLERLLLADRAWLLPVWQERYQRHPLIGPMVRRLIWRFQPEAGDAVLAMPAGGGLVDAEGRLLGLLPESTAVRIWHPLGSDPAEVLRWRRFLEERSIVQPFKQAHRELYAVAAVERGGRMASDRFAAHIIRQQQFKALCDERGWRYQIQGAHVRGDGRAMCVFDGWGLRAVFVIEPAGTDPGNGARAPYYAFLRTGMVQFNRLDGTEIPLGEVPDLILSEAMRDLDLFVGVCSIGNDPNWSGRDAGTAHAGYWRSYAFAELSEASAARRQVLQQLLPRLPIGPRCMLDGRFLVVRGDLRTYKIHIGSGNVLMSPNDTFLVIGRTTPPSAAAGGVFLPFEGDTMLARILGTATALAADTKIADRSIRKQIGDPR